jgi:hypothetical protein
VTDASPQGISGPGGTDRWDIRFKWMTQRGGRVHATVVRKGDSGGIARHVEEFVVPSAILYTDEYIGYDRVG